MQCGHFCAEGIFGERFGDGSLAVRLAQFNIIAALHHRETTHVTCTGTSKHSHSFLLLLFIYCMLFKSYFNIIVTIKLSCHQCFALAVLVGQEGRASCRL